MYGFSVDVGRLTGLGSDLADLADHVRSSTARITDALALPAETAGLLSAIDGPLRRFSKQVSEARGQDQHSLRSFGSDLAAASQDYVQLENRGTDAFATIGGQAATGTTDPAEVRFPALDLPSVSDAQSPSLSVREAVEATAQRLAPYDERLGETIGIKPAADFLTPIASDWEQLGAIGARIRQLGTTDQSLATNVQGSVDWISHYWSGTAAQAFSTAAMNVRGIAADRATHMDRIAVVVEQGGRCLERLARNQATSLAADVLRPMSFLGLTLPLGVWARLTGLPIRADIRSQIQARVDAMKQTAQTRHNQIQAIVSHIQDTLDYRPGGSMLQQDESLLQLPNGVVNDFAVSEYGFGSNIWWEDNHASAS
jgi:hypothetical protein